MNEKALLKLPCYEYHHKLQKTRNGVGDHEANFYSHFDIPDKLQSGEIIRY